MKNKVLVHLVSDSFNGEDGIEVFANASVAIAYFMMLCKDNEFDQVPSRTSILEMQGGMAFNDNMSVSIKLNVEVQ